MTENDCADFSFTKYSNSSYFTLKKNTKYKILGISPVVCVYCYDATITRTNEDVYLMVYSRVILTASSYLTHFPNNNMDVFLTFLCLPWWPLTVHIVQVETKMEHDNIANVPCSYGANCRK